MAIYHFSMQRISRGKGKSAVGSSAYRAGEKLENERDGLTHDYTKRNDVVHKEIIAPYNAPEWTGDREKLWNEVERSEKRKDANTAREINVALPRELDREKQIELVRNFVQENFTEKRIIADVAIHDKNDGNPHAHIMITTRAIASRASFPSYTGINQDGFDNKKISHMDDKETLEKWRENWAKEINKSLEKENIKDRVDHRSFEDQGIKKIPTKHEGQAVRAMEKKGIKTEIGSYNRQVETANKQSQLIDRQIAVLERSIVDNERFRANGIDNGVENRDYGVKDRQHGDEGRTNGDDKDRDHRDKGRNRENQRESETDKRSNIGTELIFQRDKKQHNIDNPKEQESTGITTGITGIREESHNNSSKYNIESREHGGSFDKQLEQVKRRNDKAVFGTVQNSDNNQNRKNENMAENRDSVSDRNGDINSYNPSNNFLQQQEPDNRKTKDTNDSNKASEIKLIDEVKALSDIVKKFRNNPKDRIDNLEERRTQLIKYDAKLIQLKQEREELKFFQIKKKKVIDEKIKQTNQLKASDIESLNQTYNIKPNEIDKLKSKIMKECNRELAIVKKIKGIPDKPQAKSVREKLKVIKENREIEEKEPEKLTMEEWKRLIQEGLKKRQKPPPPEKTKERGGRDDR
jgi:hypothetical protein